MTNSNAYLLAEHFTGAEGGVRATVGRQVALHGNFFWGETTDPVANVTLNSTPQLITRMRQNLGRTQSWGFQAGADLHLTSRIELNATYQFIDLDGSEFPGRPNARRQQGSAGRAK